MPVILAHHTSHGGRGRLVPPLLRSLRDRLRRRADLRPTTEDALVRALCHDMRGSLSCLESALHHLDRATAAPDEVLVMAQAQAAHLTSLLRTAEATGGAPPRRTDTGRMLPEVIAASVAASGLPREQLRVRVDATASAVEVGDARLQRILVNLLENAHRHGNGAPVALGITSGGGWVELAVT